MASSSEDPLPVERSASTDRAESYGPVTLMRYIKGDGRALILYTREQPPRDASAPREQPQKEPREQAREEPREQAREEPREEKARRA